MGQAVAGFSERLNLWLERLGWPEYRRPGRLADATGVHYNTAYRWLSDDPTLKVAEIEAIAAKVLPGCPPELIAWLAVSGLPAPWSASSPTDCWRELWDAARRLGAFSELTGADAARLAELLGESVDRGLPLDLAADALVRARIQSDKPRQ